MVTMKNFGESVQNKHYTTNLRLLSDYRETIYFFNYTKTNNEEVDIYVQHVSSLAKIINFIDMQSGEMVGEEAGQEKIVE